MTITTENYAPLRYSCNGVATSFSITWPFEDNTDINAVYVASSKASPTTLTLNSNYTLSGGSGGTGTLTTSGNDPQGNNPYDNGTIIITRDTPITQQVDYRTTRAFSPIITERALDKLTKAIQERESNIDFCLKIPSTSNISSIDTILESPTANGTLVWNAEATKIISGSTVDSPVSAWGATFIDDTSASAAMGTLGFDDFFKTMISATSKIAFKNFLNFSTFFQTLIGVDNTSELWTATPLHKGYFDRPAFTWASGTAIYISPGTYDHRGTTNQLLSWDSTITFHLGSGGSNAASDDLAVNSKVYIYLDDSAIVTGASTTLTASCFINKSGTAPTFSNPKHGLYDGLDRCIFGVVCSSTTAIMRKFYHSGGRRVIYESRIQDKTSADVDTSFTEVQLTGPAFAREFDCTLLGTGGAAGSYAYWQERDSSETDGHVVCAYSSGDKWAGSAPMFTNASQMIKVKLGVSDNGTLGVFTNGFYLPKGM